MLAALVILPMVVGAFVALILGSRNRYTPYIALASSIISLIIAALMLNSPQQSQNVAWFTLGTSSFVLNFALTPIHMLLLMIVAVITPLILTYSIGFMRLPSERSRYYFEILLFASSMMLFSISGGFLTLFIGWELLGVTSYLLIGFWYAKELAPTAARKAITTILIGDLAMFGAMLMLWNSYDSFSFAVIQNVQHSTASTVALSLILVAAFTKSAQFPFNEWLPDAMEGPTPVSAFLHSSTMVKAGVFMVAILLPIYAGYGMLMPILAIGIISTVIGATNALASTHIKRILAYSTIEDLGLMFIALGLNAFGAAIILFVMQTFYKALLFMNAGAIMKSNSTEEVWKSYESRSYRPLFICAVIGALSLAGLFPLSGFFGKQSVEGASMSNIPVYAILVVVQLITGLYIFRWLLIPARKAPDSLAPKVRGGFKAVPMAMKLPIYILAAFVVVASALYLFVPSYIDAVVPPISLPGAAAATILVIATLLVSYYVYLGKSAIKAEQYLSRYRRLAILLYNNVFINLGYIWVAKLFNGIAYAVDRFDYWAYGKVKLIAGSLNGIGRMLSRMESGNVTTYAVAFVAGLTVLIIIFGLL
ncbi:MAG: NADH-quinone oxidoreductase subunit L [Candidatus Micrarchaeota archaeon]|nr:NADH-quinone oxidoreductase subunit L [Candidatus Micrarchaeota archaeon]